MVALVTKFVNEGKILPRTTDELTLLLPTGFVAEWEGRLVGFAALEIYSRKLAEIRSLCVDPAMQGKGVGKKLTQACIDLARERNIFEVMVITSSENFFRGCGFDFTLPGEKKALFLQTRETP
jgi:amino-acid N-acetyltransferase